MRPSQRDDGRARVVGPFAVVTGAVAIVCVVRARGAALALRDQICREVDMCKDAVGVKVQVRPLERHVGVRRAVVVLDVRTVRLLAVRPINPVGREKVRAHVGRAAVDVLYIRVGVIKNVPVAALVGPHDCVGELWGGVRSGSLGSQDNGMRERPWHARDAQGSST